MSEIKTTKPAAKADVPTGFKRVIIRRPYGVTDSHQWFGFNEYGAQIQFDAPVVLPELVVNHIRNIDRVEYHADKAGEPMASYSPAYNVIDA